MEGVDLQAHLCCVYMRRIPFPNQAVASNRNVGNSRRISGNVGSKDAGFAEPLGQHKVAMMAGPSFAGKSGRLTKI